MVQISSHATSVGCYIGNNKKAEQVCVKFQLSCCSRFHQVSHQPLRSMLEKIHSRKTRWQLLVEWSPSYPFPRIGINFIGLLLLSVNNKRILSISDLFTKCSEAILLPEHTTPQKLRFLLKAGFVESDASIDSTTAKPIFSSLSISEP